MATTSKHIDELLAVRSECEHLEFKSAENRFDFEELVDYCVAMANEGGGRIVLGITDQIPRRVVGTAAFDVPERTVAGIYQRLNLKVSFEEVVYLGARILIFQVPGRPIASPIQYRGRYSMRAGGTLVAMTPDKLRDIFDEGKPEWLLQPAKDACGDADIVRLLHTQRFFDLLRVTYPTTQIGVLEKLEGEKLIQRKNPWIITRLGALLLAKDLRDFDSLAGKAAPMVVYRGIGKMETRLDATYNSGYAVGFQDMVNGVVALIPANEVIERALRQEHKMIPEIAVRELIANALIHQDFDLTGMSVMIELYDDRIEISNPGLPLIPVDRFIDGYQSRNDRLANLMRRLSICEEKGSGIDKVARQAEVYQLPAPDFRVGFNRTSIVLFGHLDFQDMDRAGRIRACYQHACLKWVMNETLSNQSLRERFQLNGLQSASITQVIKATLEEGKIKLANPAQTSLRYRHYIPYWA